MSPAGEWWRDYFDERFVDLYSPFLTPARTHAEVDGIERVMDLTPGAAVLDLACGWGRHSVELARRGYAVTGLDFSPELLARARRQAEKAGVSVEWVRGDMRELPWTGRFDAVLSLFSSMGYFLSDTEDLRVLRAAHRALRPGGWLLLDTMHRDFVVGDFADRDWWETEAGVTVWVEREFDALEGVSSEWLRWSDGERSGEKFHALRIRSATEWDGLLRRGGFEPIEWHGDWELAPFVHGSESLIIKARKRRP